MTELQREQKSLARAFASRAQSKFAGECPAAEQIFDAASGELTRSHRLAIIDHVSRCAACTQAWQLATELGARPPTRENESSRRDFSRSTRRFMPGLAVAASVVAAVGATFLIMMPSQNHQAHYREIQPSAPASSLTSERLPRDRFLLQWSAGPPGTTYSVRVSTTDLHVLFSADSLTEPQVLVPPSALAGTAQGSPLLWQVEMLPPQGERVASATFVVTLTR
ncbi:MAG: hypothetical protein ACJ8MH_00345 [Povalibacter sp.]